jgi:hypothetical protein
MHYPVHSPIRRNVSPTVLSVALVVFAAAWFSSAWIFYATNLDSKDGVSAAPVWSLGVLILVPLISVVLAPCMVQGRRAGGGKLHGVDYVALLAAVSPVIFIVIMYAVAYVRNG